MPAVCFVLGGERVINQAGKGGLSRLQLRHGCERRPIAFPRVAWAAGRNDIFLDVVAALARRDDVIPGQGDSGCSAVGAFVSVLLPDLSPRCRLGTPGRTSTLAASTAWGSLRSQVQSVRPSDSQNVPICWRIHRKLRSLFPFWPLCENHPAATWAAMLAAISSLVVADAGMSASHAIPGSERLRAAWSQEPARPILRRACAAEKHVLNRPCFLASFAMVLVAGNCGVCSGKGELGISCHFPGQSKSPGSLV